MSDLRGNDSLVSIFLNKAYLETNQGSGLFYILPSLAGGV
jgi:hypothetical protein